MPNPYPSPFDDTIGRSIYIQYYPQFGAYDANMNDQNDTIQAILGQGDDDHAGADNIDLGSGDDVAETAGGNDTINAGRGDDQVFADQYAYAGPGGGEYAGFGDDKVNGEEGNDYLSGQSGNDELYGGEDNDTVLGGDGSDYLDGGDGNDRLDADDTTFENPVGDGAADTVHGGAGNDGIGNGRNGDQLFGDAGDDSIDVTYFSDEPGKITIDGGAGANDTLSVTYVTDKDVTFSFVTFQGLGLVVSGIEKVSSIATGEGNDTITMSNADSLHAAAGNGNNLVTGGNGISNTIAAGTGNDTIHAGNGGIYMTDMGGNNVIASGTGSDRIIVSGNVSGTVDLGGGYWDRFASDYAAVGGSSVNVTVTGRDASFNYFVPKVEGTYVFKLGSGFDKIFANAADAQSVADLVSFYGITESTPADDALRHITIDYSNYTSGVTANLSTGVGTNPKGSASSDDSLGLIATDHSVVDNVGGSMFRDNITGDSTANRLDGGVGNDILVGHGGADLLNGGYGNDVLGGEAGDDTLDGGTGLDTASYVRAKGGVYVDLGRGIGGSGNEGSDVLRHIEEVVGSKYGDRLVGSATDDTLNGGAGNDTLEGGTGFNSLKGGAGVDAVSYETVKTGVYISLGNNDLVLFAEAHGKNIDDTLFDDTEDAIGSQGADTIIGSDLGTNRLEGLAGKDILNGGGGNDTLDGGAGIDWADFGSAGAPVTASLATGKASGYGRVTLIDMENLEGSATKQNTLSGDADANQIRGGRAGDLINGGGGNDFIIGGGGSDVLNGGAGDDYIAKQTLQKSDVPGLWTATFSNGGNSHFSGGAGNDTIYAGDGNDAVTGDAGNDVIGAGLGTDTYDGGGGIDEVVYYYTPVKFGVTASLDKGTVTGGSGAATVSDHLIAIENLAGTLFSDTLFGDGGANRLVSFDGNDILGGDGGNDTLMGGDGDDTYLFEKGTAIIEKADEGSDDAVISSFTYTLGANVENLSLEGLKAINGTGNALANTIVGNAGANLIDGANGGDRLYGGLGNDTLTGGPGLQIIDTFVFDTAPNTTKNRDHITDFKHGVDKIDLDQTVFASLSPGRLAAADFTDKTPTTAHQFIQYDPATGLLTYDSNGATAGGKIVEFAVLDNHPADLSAADFTILA